MPVVSALLLTLVLQTKVTPAVKEARTLAKAAETYAGKNKAKARLYMLQSNKWVAMKTDGDHLKDEMWREDVSLVAFRWDLSGKYSIVSYTAGSPSGDWSGNKVSTYRSDGTLSHSSYRFAAFMFSGLSLDEETVYDAKGKKIFSLFTLTDLNGKPRKSKEEQSQMVSSRPQIKDYMKTSQLPFK